MPTNNMRDHAATVLAHQSKLAEDAAREAAATLPRDTAATLPRDTAATLPRDTAATVSTDPTEADALAAMAEDATTAAQTDDETIGRLIEADDAVVGVTYQSALTMKNFVPAGDPAWLPREMAGQPRGAKHVILGRIRGTVNKTVARETPWEGKMLQSIELQGGFQALVNQSGQLLSAASLFLSRAFAVQIETSLAEARRDDPHATIAIDVDVGVESTGKTIAYTWTVTHYLNGQAMRALRALRQPRKLIPNGSGVPQLEHSPPSADLRLPAVGSAGTAD